jgi:hypothetical protein
LISSRGRFIAPIADLSALGGCDDVRIKKVLCIIGLCRLFRYPDLLANLYNDVPTLQEIMTRTKGEIFMSYPTNNQGMIANYLPVSEFQPGHTEFACGAFATASNAWATPYNQPARTDAQNLINWAEAEYAKTAGDNGPTNTNGASIPDMHTYFTDTQQGGVIPNPLHSWDTAISNTSDQTTDINTIKAALLRGYPVIATITEQSVFDLDLGANPYWWGPGGNHILTWVGISSDGNLLAVDNANVIQGDGNLQTPKTPQPQPRRYDITRIANQWASIIQLPWLPPIISGDPLSWPGEIQLQAQAVWAGSPVNAPSGLGIYKAWLSAYTTKLMNFGTPITLEFKTINWNNQIITIQYFSGGIRAEFGPDGTTTFYDYTNKQVYKA